MVLLGHVGLPINSTDGFIQWLNETLRGPDNSWTDPDPCFWWTDPDPCFWWVEAAFQMLLLMQFTVHDDKLIHWQPFLSQKHDSGDRIPAVLWAAACLPGAEAMVGRVHRLPVGGYADDRCVRVYFTGRCLDSCHSGSESKTLSYWNLLKELAVWFYIM